MPPLDASPLWSFHDGGRASRYLAPDRAKASQTGSAPVEVEPRPSSHFRGARRANSRVSRRMVAAMLKTRMTAGQIELREGVEAALVANKIARAVALGEGLPESDFDYAGVPQESRAEVHKLTASFKRATGKHFAVIVEIGEDLSKAKELLGHGNFLPWLQAEFRWSERTARNYMSLAAHFQGKSANFADLDVSTGLALAAAPAEVKDPIMQRVEAGEIISKAEVEAAIHVVRPGQVQGRPPPARAVPPYTRIVAVGDEAAAQAPVMTGADFRRVGARQAADELLRSLSAIAAALARHQDIGEIVATLTDAEQNWLREGVETVGRLKAALGREKPNVAGFSR